MEPTWNSLTSDIVTNNQDQKIGTENVSLNAFGMVLSTVSLVAQIEKALNLECKKSIKVMTKFWKNEKLIFQL